jgi:hypothetical protein
MSDFGCVYEGFLDFGVRYDYLKFTLKTATRIQKRYTILPPQVSAPSLTAMP